jgi:chemotaxis protein MotB
MRKPTPLPVPFELPAEPDCPRCPKKGAPAWMATFADIATLLMAFFVLILSFAEFNVPKFKMVAGSLERAFGVQREVPVMEMPQGTTILELNFSPSPEISMTEEMRQNTTETNQPEIKQPDADDDARDGSAQAQQQAEEMVQDLAQDIAQALQTEQGQDVVKELLQDLSQELARLQGDVSAAEQAAALADATLRVALREEVAQGLVTIDQREDRVIITVGAGGAFASGSADLTPAARDIMARLAFSAMGDASDIVVTGHTDDVPLAPGSPLGDNWGLAAARASAVVREIEGTALIAPERLTAISRGETQPLTDNSTAAGRAENRRIEIEITY